MKLSIVTAVSSWETTYKMYSARNIYLTKSKGSFCLDSCERAQYFCTLLQVVLSQLHANHSLAWRKRMLVPKM